MASRNTDDSTGDHVVSDREIIRTWTRESIGIKIIQIPLFEVRAEILFRTTVLASAYEMSLRRAPSVDVELYEQEKARRCLWEYIHRGLREPLIEALADINRARYASGPFSMSSADLVHAEETIEAVLKHLAGGSP